QAEDGIRDRNVTGVQTCALPILGRSGGFQTEMKERSMIAQVALKDVSNIDTAIKNIQESEEQIIELANAAHPSILNYGGGAQRIETRLIPADKEMKTPQFLVY